MAVEQLDAPPAIDGLVPRQRRLKNRKAVVDSDAVAAAVLRDWQESGNAEAFRPLLLDTIKAALEAGRAEIRRRFIASNDGAEAVRAGAFLMDVLVRQVCDAAVTRVYPTPNPTQAEQACVAAVGGYGRGELAPQTDIDLLFLPPYKEPARIEQVEQRQRAVRVDDEPRDRRRVHREKGLEDPRLSGADRHAQDPAAPAVLAVAAGDIDEVAELRGEKPRRPKPRKLTR